jgi:glutamine---fructose-6-phosphate transaminase (isomerizing)
MLNRLPVALAAPSLFTVYGTPPRLGRALVIGISQSGQSPDVVSVVEEGKRQGAATIAITNDPESPMAQTAHHHIYLGVGKERSVAATKTYTAQLAALALLSIKMAGLAEYEEQMQSVPEFMQRALAAEPKVLSAAMALARFDRSVVIGRGTNFASACEIAQKIKELAYVEAEPYSAADFRHGTIALADASLSALVVSLGTTFREELAGLRADLRARDARLAVISDQEDFEPAELAIPMPAGLPEWLAPLAAVLPGQLLAYHLTVARGWDPDQPRTIQKVTRTY